MIYFVRHGQTDWNKRKVMQGSIDIPLNDDGIAHAKMLKEKFSNIAFDKVFCSPLIRARQTAEIIMEGRPEQIEYVDCLKERSYGKYEGEPKSSFDYNNFWNYADEEGMESFFSFAWPLTHFIYNELLNKYADKNVLIVSHGGVSKWFEILLGENSILPQDVGAYLPKNTEVMIYSNVKKNRREYYKNLSKKQINSSNNISIITPNILSKYTHIDKQNLKSSKPKFYYRNACFIITPQNRLVLLKAKKTNEIKIGGWKLDKTKSVYEQIKRRFGFEVDEKTIREEQKIIEIKFNDANGEVVISTFFSAKSLTDEPSFEPNFNTKEKKEGVELITLSPFEAIAAMEKSINKIKTINVDDPDYRPKTSKQSIELRDKIAITKFINKLLDNYFDK